MQSRTHLLCAVTLITAMRLGSAAIAADLPKEGTYDYTYARFWHIQGYVDR